MPKKCIPSKNSQQTMTGKEFNLIEGIYEKPIATIILNYEILNPTPLTSRTRQACPHQLFYSTIYWRF